MGALLRAYLLARDVIRSVRPIVEEEVIRRRLAQARRDIDRGVAEWKKLQPQLDELERLTKNPRNPEE